MLTSKKLREPWYQKVSFAKLHMCVYLCADIQISSIILMGFKQGVIFPLPYLKTNR